MPTGTHVRLGALIPSANLLTEPDMYRMAPRGVTVHFSRMKFLGDSLEQFGRMMDDLPASCRFLLDANVDAYVFACTTGTMLGGNAVDQQVIDMISGITDRPA